MHILDDLKFRGLLNQFTDFDSLYERLKRPCVLYCGFDATADSLHIGNLLALVCLKRFQKFNHKPIALLGGGTSLIGDPSGKKSERTLNSKETVDKWSKKIEKQFKAFFGSGNYVIDSNYEWLGKAKLLDFLRDIGKYFSVSSMLKKESVRSRIESGISFTEFSYMLLQAYDFLELNKKYDCQLQIGGSDQFGNIIAGIDVIRKVSQKDAFGLTFPLVTKAGGAKFGKTELGTVWLDPEKTSPYQFYQFWVNVDDEDVIKFIRYFTFLSYEDITALENEVKDNPQKRVAQRTLAEEVTKMVHGERAFKKSEEISKTLFEGDLKSLSNQDINNAFGHMPSSLIEKNEIKLIDLLVESKISVSKRQAREDAQSGSIFINGEPCSDPEKNLTAKDQLFGKYIIIRKGKKQYFLVQLKSRG